MQFIFFYILHAIYLFLYIACNLSFFIYCMQFIFFYILHAKIFKYFFLSLQVSNIVGRTELLCAVFFLLSFFVYSQSVHNGRPSFHSWPGLCLSVCLAVISLLCKEQGVTVLGVVWVYDLVIVSQLDLDEGLKYLSLILKNLYPTLKGESKTKRYVSLTRSHSWLNCACN